MFVDVYINLQEYFVNNKLFGNQRECVVCIPLMATAETKRPQESESRKRSDVQSLVLLAGVWSYRNEKA
jgi:hypothetical protein